MCGRGVRPEGPELVEALEALEVDDDVRTLPARYNLAPTDPMGVLSRGVKGRRLSIARWGVPRQRGGLAFNARGDRLRSGMWRALLPRGRVVVPLRGFYEWQGPQRQPWYFRRADGALLLLAGLVSEDVDGRHATIITTEPSTDVAGVHDRMPAVLEPDMVEPWLAEFDPHAIESLVVTASAGTLVRHAVSSRVNNVRNDGAGLLDEVTPAAVQTELF